MNRAEAWWRKGHVRYGLATEQRDASKVRGQDVSATYHHLETSARSLRPRGEGVTRSTHRQREEVLTQAKQILNAVSCFHFFPAT